MTSNYVSNWEFPEAEQFAHCLCLSPAVSAGACRAVTLLLVLCRATFTPHNRTLGPGGQARKKSILLVINFEVASDFHCTRRACKF